LNLIQIHQEFSYSVSRVRGWRGEGRKGGSEGGGRECGCTIPPPLIVGILLLQITTLLSDIGGQLGLWVGLSVITFAEVGDLLLSVIMLAFSKD
jgi:hypothetical protein